MISLIPPFGWLPIGWLWAITETGDGHIFGPDEIETAVCGVTPEGLWFVDGKPIGEDALCSDCTRWANENMA